MFSLKGFVTLLARQDYTDPGLSWAPAANYRDSYVRRKVLLCFMLVRAENIKPSAQVRLVTVRRSTIRLGSNPNLAINEPSTSPKHSLN